MSTARALQHICKAAARAAPSEVSAGLCVGEPSREPSRNRSAAGPPAAALAAAYPSIEHVMAPAAWGAPVNTTFEWGANKSSTGKRANKKRLKTGENAPDTLHTKTTKKGHGDRV